MGDRLEHIIGLDRSKVAAGIVLMAPFVPMIFQGEEYAASTPFQFFADHEDPEMAKSVSEGRKRDFAAFGWKTEEIPDPEKRETFERSKLNWNELHEGQHAEMLDWYTKLIHLRRSSMSLNDGDRGHVKITFDEQKRWLVMDRGLVKIAINLGGERVEIGNAGNFRLLLASRGDIVAEQQKVILGPDTMAILSGEMN